MTTDREHLAALLAHHADVLAARWHSAAQVAEPGAWERAAASSLREHASDLTADETTPFVRELLDSIAAFEAEHPAAAPSAPADQTADLARAHREAFRLASEITRLRDRNRSLERVSGENRLLTEELQRTEAEVERLRADRAAVLREAADEIERMQHDRDDVVNDALGGLDRITEAQHTAVHRAAARLRLMADEAQQAEATDTCRPVEVDGETVLVRGSQEMTEQEQGYLADIVRAAKRKYAAERSDTTEEPRP